MQNSYSDNRCCGVSYPTLCAVACACTRAIPEPMLYTIFPSAYRCVSFHVSLRSSLCCVTLCPYMPLFSRLSTIVLQPFGFQYRRLPFYCRLIFRQPPPPLLSLVSFLSYNRSGPFFFIPLVSSDYSCRRIWAPPYIPYRSRHSDFFFCFIFFSGDFLFICRTKS